MTQAPAIQRGTTTQGFSATTPADAAIKNILKNLLALLRSNEAAIARRADIEALHQYRVAARKTRTLLSLSDNIFAKRELKTFNAAFKWLGKLTGSARDLDIYLEKAGENIPPPLKLEIQHEQAEHYQYLSRTLAGKRYARFIERYLAFLDKPVPASTKRKFAKWPVKSVADKRIWKMYKDIARLAEAIHADSPPTKIHKLRRMCKRLRYMLDVFQELYDQNQLHKIIKSLKSIQNTLGDYNDACMMSAYLQQNIGQHQALHDLNADTVTAMIDFQKHIDDHVAAGRSQSQHALTKLTSQSMYDTLYGLCKKCPA